MGKELACKREDHWSLYLSTSVIGADVAPFLYPHPTSLQALEAETGIPCGKLANQTTQMSEL